ncbi:MAG: alpha-glucan family phosphorylase [Polyangiaceae bacterium]|nr:alpha-glucan family phosphorylase [Polyangiaceae bacterium]
MHTLHRFHVFPRLPNELKPLVDLAKNLTFSFCHEARELFREVDPEIFVDVNENPLALLGRVNNERLDELSKSSEFLSKMGRVVDLIGAYQGRKTWFDKTHRDAQTALGRSLIAYFSMEFGVHECLPVYSGGLGVLAGDHLKSASDLGLPLVGVGIAFSKGYFHQALDIEGWQTERYPPNDWHDLPVSPALLPNGQRASVTVALPIALDAAGGLKLREVAIEAWVVQVGRVKLYLLDADLDQNAEGDRALTNTLYGGDRSHRIRQEILLGVGGYRMLRTLGVDPAICHMNEGHSAFLAIERIRRKMVDGSLSFAAAREVCAAGNVFTTHTPVPAGNDAFPRDMVLPYLEALAKEMGVPTADLLALGRLNPADDGSEFSMPVLAIRTADTYNGVSALHGREARSMWKSLWPDVPVDDIPIGSVTNGVHAGTWIAPRLAKLYSGVMGNHFLEEGCSAEVWNAVHNVPDQELWNAHQTLRAELVTNVRKRLRATAKRRGKPDDATIAHLLDPSILTIGFARRFATYKRGTLLLRDPARLHKILNHAERPVQLVFAGKAHPQDIGGKELIRDIVRASRQNGFRGRIVFIEDYNMGIARELVSGVDVWLNTPRRPLEASGTSGMKAAVNGVLHASILDGWWCEAYTGDNGFAIGGGEEYQDSGFGDHVEAQALYRLLEEELIPLFYERNAQGIPHKWVARMKRSIASVGPYFNTHRMVKEYVEKCYAQAADRTHALAKDGCKLAITLSEWRTRVEAAWPDVKVDEVTWPEESKIAVSEALRVEATVTLPKLTPADVSVELYYGKVHGDHAFTGGKAVEMNPVAELGDGKIRYAGTISPSEAGEHAFAVRVLPKHAGLHGPHAMGLIAWQ